MMADKIVLFGEYLLRLTPPDNQKIIQSDRLTMHWAGSEANIAVSLSIFNNPTLYVSAMPDNELARAGTAELHKYSVSTHIHKSGGRMGLYYYESGQGSRPGRVTYDRDNSAFSNLKSGILNWDEILDSAKWFHWSGITPALNAGTAAVCKEALETARKKGITISADFNYRQTLWNYGKPCNEVMPELLQYCDVILGDVDTAIRYFNIEPDKNDLVGSTFKLLQQHLPQVKYITMTMRNQISASQNEYIGYLWHNNQIATSAGYNIQQIAERIGAGDAFMAGIIHGLYNNYSPEKTIELATACGVIKHSITGDFNIATLQEVETIIQQKGSGKIIR